MAKVDVSFNFGANAGKRKMPKGAAGKGKKAAAKGGRKSDAWRSYTK